MIPREARNIRVEEVAGANNYLAMRDNQGKYLLNGHWFIQWSGDYEMAGTIVHYERNGNKEKMEASGPLKEPIHIMVWGRGTCWGIQLSTDFMEAAFTDYTTH